jgi:hypothetical protein
VAVMTVVAIKTLIAACLKAVFIVVFAYFSCREKMTSSSSTISQMLLLIMLDCGSVSQLVAVGSRCESVVLYSTFVAKTNHPHQHPQQTHMKETITTPKMKQKLKMTSSFSQLKNLKRFRVNVGQRRKI